MSLNLVLDVDKGARNYVYINCSSVYTSVNRGKVESLDTNLQGGGIATTVPPVL